MRVLVPLLMLTACDGGKETAERAPRSPAVKGSLVFTPRSSAEADTMLATEQEVLRSSSILKRAAEQNRRPELSADAISVTRRRGTMILDVQVRAPAATGGSPAVDMALAATYCNELLMTYLDSRMAQRLMVANQRVEVVARELEAAPDNAELKRKLLDLQLEAQLREMDVRVLEPCTVRGEKVLGNAPARRDG